MAVSRNNMSLTVRLIKRVFDEADRRSEARHANHYGLLAWCPRRGAAIGICVNKAGDVLLKGGHRGLARDGGGT